METKIVKGKKVNMSQIFMDDGKVVPVTKIKVIDDLDESFVDKDIVIVGKSKGKGFTGVMKKWGFAGVGEATRGQSDSPRKPGSIGAQTPGRVLKGKHMAGRHGNKQVTLKGLKIAKVDLNAKELLVTGPIPGARNSNITVKVILS